ncbi:hypothetical protein AAVH_39359, partial [Aphelenchoides avenae]
MATNTAQAVKSGNVTDNGVMGAQQEVLRSDSNLGAQPAAANKKTQQANGGHAVQQRVIENVPD